MASLPAGHDRNADQIAFWNGVAGKHWTDRQSVQDIVLAPVTEKLIARADAQAGQRILDIGCGCGAIAIDLARAGRRHLAMCSASTFPCRCWNARAS